MCIIHHIFLFAAHISKGISLSHVIISLSNNPLWSELLNSFVRTLSVLNKKKYSNAETIFFDILSSPIKRVLFIILYKIDHFLSSVYKESS